MFFNSKGRFYPGTNYYQVSTGWLDYYLRTLGFRIHDVEYSGNLGRRRLFRKPAALPSVVRVAALCVLTDDALLEPDDAWGRKRLPAAELAEYQALRNGVTFNGEERLRPSHHAAGLYYAGIDRPTLDLTKVLRSKKSMPRERSEGVMRLADRLPG
jgi:hypothetical protein